MRLVVCDQLRDEIALMIQCDIPYNALLEFELSHSEGMLVYIVEARVETAFIAMD